MPQSRWLLPAGLVLATVWAALGLWQWHEWGHECEAARAALRRQAESIHNTLAGGVRSHRRLGFFFEEQLQIALEESARSEGVLAVAVLAQDGKLVLSEGDAKLIALAGSREPGVAWEPAGLRFVGEFQLEAATPGGPHGEGGSGGGGGGGRGRGWGRMRWQTEPDRQSPFAEGGRFVTVLWLDSRETEAACARAGWLRVWVVAAGGLVLACAALAWWGTLWSIDVRSRARVLEAEARHFRDLSQAAAGLAHETRNPLGLIRGWAQRLLQSPLPSVEQRERARAVVEECDRVASRINQFLAFARPCEPKPESFDPDAVIGELATLLEPDLDDRGLRIEHRRASPAAIRADRDLFRQAVFNLVANAIQFSPPGATVEIALGPGEDGGCRLDVADRGPGVPPENAGRLFTPYFTTRPEGTGLGLAIIRRIATAHGWTSGYTPRPGGGSVFWLDRMHD